MEDTGRGEQSEAEKGGAVDRVGEDVEQTEGTTSEISWTSNGSRGSFPPTGVSCDSHDINIQAYHEDLYFL